jgi:hypothetical protein
MGHPLDQIHRILSYPILSGDDMIGTRFDHYRNDDEDRIRSRYCQSCLRAPLPSQRRVPPPSKEPLYELMIEYCVRGVVRLLGSSHAAHRSSNASGAARRGTTRYPGAGPFRGCFNHCIRVIIALFDPLSERIVYLTNSLVDEARKVGGLRRHTNTNMTSHYTRDHLTISPDRINSHKLRISVISKTTTRRFQVSKLTLSPIRPHHHHLATHFSQLLSYGRTDPTVQHSVCRLEPSVSPLT